MGGTSLMDTAWGGGEGVLESIYITQSGYKIANTESGWCASSMMILWL